MHYLNTPNQLKTFRAIPEDFHFEVTLNDRGNPVTSSVGINLETQQRMGRLAAHNWLSHAAEELKALFCIQYRIEPKYVNILSEERPDGTICAWVQSRIPLPRQTLTAKKPILVLGNGDSDVIDV